MSAEPQIVNLKDIVEVQAFELYLSSRKRGFPKKIDDLTLEYDWSGVSFVIEKPEFTPVPGTEKFASNVIFKSVFENKSGTDQEHSLKVERQTVSECKCSLSKGFSTSLSLGLEIAAPEEIAKASVGYSKGFEVTNAIETTNQKSLTWATEGTITVPAGQEGETTCITAELKIKEKQCEYTFKSRVAIRGTVVVNFYSRRHNNKYLMVFTGDMQDILLDDTTNPNLKNLKTEGKTVYLDIEGQCSFKFGIEQEIVITKN